MNTNLRMKTLFFFIFTVLTFFIAHAQDNIEMADAMRSSGKIYVVVAVLVLIFSGIILFLLMTERRISRIEKKINHDK